MNIFNGDYETFKGGGSGGGKTQALRDRVRKRAPSHIWLVSGEWEPADRRVVQLASATALDVRYVREDIARERSHDSPKIIVLCGSTRFVDTWISEYQRLSDEGNIVLTVARMPPRPFLQYDDPELKIRLDRLHLHKIDLADEVFVLNVDGYIGQSTESEIRYAQSKGKVIKYYYEQRLNG